MASYYGNILEEELKNKVGAEWFASYDTTQIIGKVDFSVAVPTDGAQLFETEYLLWAEAKQGTGHDILESFIQLILTIGRARTFEQYLPPAFLGAFDAEKMAFLPYHEVMDVFQQNDFNWNVTPSDHQTKEFRQLLDLLSNLMSKSLVMFSYESDAKELRTFIKQNFRTGQDGIRQIQVTINNFTHIYAKWCKEVKPSISGNWDNMKSAGIIDADFYLADLLSYNNTTLKEKLFVLLRSNHYILDRRVNDTGLENYTKAIFLDDQTAHTQFWNRYKRPPRRCHWDKMVERRDLLVPQDIRERKGSFFTPPQWVELSQVYLAKELGENWQDEYYIWDCCAGTGNLLAGLTNKYHIYASTIDKADVEVMHTRIATMNKALHGEHGGSNLLDSHVFQFDFLNDPFNLDKPEESKLPPSLIEILKDKEKRKKLVIYINPPYAEASNGRTSSGTGSNRKGLSYTSIKDKLNRELGRAGNEIFAQFFARIITEIPTCVLAVFSTLKTLQGPNFTGFRKKYRAKLGRIFVVPANTFDNVKGQFPIGFQIYHTEEEEMFESINSDVYDSKAKYIGNKMIYSYNDEKYIIDWFRQYYDKIGDKIAYLRYLGTDFQNNRGVFITLSPSDNDLKQVKGTWITSKNILEACIYFAVRLCIEPTWLNDRDQFLYPNDEWKKDNEFQYDCLAFTLFAMQNRISIKGGTNYWIPFTEQEVDAKDAFKSHFMSNYLHGKTIKAIEPKQGFLFDEYGLSSSEMEESSMKGGDTSDSTITSPISFSSESQDVMDAGRELWRYYHQQTDAVPDAALYDIRLHFQGTNDNGNMNPSSTDEQYNILMAKLRDCLKVLSKKIASKVYEYGFLKS